MSLLHRKQNRNTSHQYAWEELCEDQNELNKILSLPEIEREKLYDEKVEK